MRYLCSVHHIFTLKPLRWFRCYWAETHFLGLHNYIPSKYLSSCILLREIFHVQHTVDTWSMTLLLLYISLISKSHGWSNRDLESFRGHFLVKRLSDGGAKSKSKNLKVLCSLTNCVQHSLHVSEKGQARLGKLVYLYIFFLSSNNFSLSSHPQVGMKKKLLPVSMETFLLLDLTFAVEVMLEKLK